MATGRIGVTPVLRTRWSKLPTTGTTVLSGLDDNSVALVYDAGYEAVYRNGVLLSRGNDYTATDGTTVTLIDATLATDIIEIFANDLVPLTDAISKGQYNAKGALLSATAASTPAVLAVGTNDQVLTADSSTSTGLKWATATAAGKNYSLLNAGGTALTGAATITVSGISGIDSILIFVFEAGSANAQSSMSVRLNSDSGTNYTRGGIFNTGGTTFGVGTLDTTGATNGTSVLVGRMSNTAASKVNGFVRLDGCNTAGVKIYESAGSAENQSGTGTQQFVLGGVWDNSATVSSVSIISSTGNFDEGTIYIYGAA